MARRSRLAAWNVRLSHAQVAIVRRPHVLGRRPARPFARRPVADASRRATVQPLGGVAAGDEGLGRRPRQDVREARPAAGEPAGEGHVDEPRPLGHPRPDPRGALLLRDRSAERDGRLRAGTGSGPCRRWRRRSFPHWPDDRSSSTYPRVAASNSLHAIAGMSPAGSGPSSGTPVSRTRYQFCSHASRPVAPNVERLARADDRELAPRSSGTRPGSAGRRTRPRCGRPRPGTGRPAGDASLPDRQGRSRRSRVRSRRRRRRRSRRGRTRPTPPTRRGRSRRDRRRAPTGCPMRWPRADPAVATARASCPEGRDRTSRRQSDGLGRTRSATGRTR